MQNATKSSGAGSAPAGDGQRSTAWLRLLLLAVPVLALGLAPAELEPYARFSLMVFAATVCAWTFTSLDETFVALLAALSLALSGFESPSQFFATLGHPMVWLLIGACVVAEAVRVSGLSVRFASAAARRARSVGQMFYALTGVMLAAALVIPSTTARAALMLPVFTSLSGSLKNARITRALALLIPSVVLLSSVGSLLGAGANVVAVDLLERMTGAHLDYLDWLAMGLPFAIVSSFGSAWLIQRLFLTSAERSLAMSVESEEPAAGFSRPERVVLLSVVTLVVLWVTEPLHGIDNVLVALLGALALTAPRLGVLPLGAAIKRVEWNLVLFMASALKLCTTLVDSGAVNWIVQRLMQAVHEADSTSLWLAILITTVLSLAAHLVITSRTARVSVLVPLVVVLASTCGANAVVLVFASVTAAGFCLTLPVSAKPVALFWKLEQPTFEARDLLRMSSVLAVLHLFLVLGFASVIWPRLVS